MHTWLDKCLVVLVQRHTIAKYEIQSRARVVQAHKQLFSNAENIWSFWLIAFFLCIYLSRRLTWDWPTFNNLIDGSMTTKTKSTSEYKSERQTQRMSGLYRHHTQNAELSLYVKNKSNEWLRVRLVMSGKYWATTVSVHLLVRLIRFIFRCCGGTIVPQ